MDTPEIPVTTHASFHPLLDDSFAHRHIGPNDAERRQMLDVVGQPSLDALLDAAIPESIRMRTALNLPPAVSESQVLDRLRELAAHNQVLTSMIGMGYYGTITPPVILRNVLENPAWYTSYTPYQPEISQGRLEALLNFQTMVSDLVGLDLANASLLDEATAAAEAMTMARRVSKHASDKFFVDIDTHPQTISVLHTRAEPLGIELILDDPSQLDPTLVFGGLLSYPGSSGQVRHPGSAIAARGNSTSDGRRPRAISVRRRLCSPILPGSTLRGTVPKVCDASHAASTNSPASRQRHWSGQGSRCVRRCTSTPSRSM